MNTFRPLPGAARPAAGARAVAAARSVFDLRCAYLDTATTGLPPRAAAHALTTAIADWAAGTPDLAGYDEAVTTARATYARIVGVDPAEVAIGSQTAAFVGMIAASLPPGAQVLAAEDDFTSLLFPFLAQPGVTVRLVPLARLASEVRPRTHLVAVSAAQSRDGDLADLAAIRAAAATVGARTLVDLTQSAGWLPVTASDFDFTVCSAYKWLLCPRGTAFLTVRPDRRHELRPVHANWYGGADVWSSVYGGPLRLAAQARRFDLSPAWLCWVGAVPALRLVEAAGVAAIGRHDVALANRFRAGVGLPSAASPIVAVRLGADQPLADAPARLAAAGVRAAVRAGRIRLAFHLYNTEAHVRDALAALTDVLAATA